MTAKSAKCSLHLLTTFDPSAVVAHFLKNSKSFFVMSIGSAISATLATAISQALSKPSAILSGWIPLSRSFWACSRMAPARTTTPVVPSPISLS